MRDGLPLTRPTRWAGGLANFDEPGKLITYPLLGGAVNMGERVVLTIRNNGHITDRWVSIAALIAIDGQPYLDPKPCQLYIPRWWGVVESYIDDVAQALAWEYSGWSAVINFPQLSVLENFKGTHTLLLRAMVCDAR